jgi:WD40 repeat protein
MFRWFMTLLLVGVICFGVAWAAGWLDPSAGADDVPYPGQEVTPVELGGLLYPARELKVERVAPGKVLTADPIVIPDCHFVVTQKIEVSSPKTGHILFIGEEVTADDPLTPREIKFRLINQGKYKIRRNYIPWEEGKVVREGQLLALVDPALALGELRTKQVKIEIAKKDLETGKAAAEEANARYKRARDAGTATSKQELSEAFFIFMKYTFEAQSKENAIGIAVNEADQAEIDLRRHEVRNTLKGDSIIKKIYKKAGEGIKELETIMELHNISSLKVEGLVDAQYKHKLREGMKVILEPLREESPFRTVPAHRKEVTGVAFSFDPGRPDDPLFVSASEDGTVAVWRRSEEDQLAILWHESPVRSVACSPPGSAKRWCAAGCADGTISLWNLDDILGKHDKSGLPRPVHILKGQHRDAVTALAFGPKGQWLASGGHDNTICLWHTENGSVVYPFDAKHGVTNPHQGSITTLHFTPQSRLISASRDNTIRIWELHQNGTKLVGIPIPGRSGAVANLGVSADGSTVLFDHGTELHLLSLKDGRLMQTLKKQPGAGPFETFAVFSPDASLILAGGLGEGRMQLWRTPAAGTRGYEVRQYAAESRSPITCATFSPQAGIKGIGFAVSGNRDGHVHIWDVPDRDSVRKHQLASQPDGRPLTLDLFDPGMEGSKMRIAINVQNVSAEHPRGRFSAGERVTVVIQP